MKRFVCSVAATVLLISTAIAYSQDSSQKWYVTGDAGAVFQQGATFEQTTVPTRTATYNPGLRIDVGGGYHFYDSFAAELETGFMWNSVDKVGGVSLSSIGQSVDFYSVPILANLVYKVPIKFALVPYLGVGGGGVVNVLDVVPSGNNDTDVVPALQAEAGLKYQFNQHASIGLAYKFLTTLDERYYLHSFNDHLKISGVYIHGVFVNFTWKF